MRNFDALNAKIAEFEKQIREEGSVLFQEIAKELFDKYPELNSFSWTQYTPYFNDGDACQFTVYDVCAINGYDEDEEDEYDGEGENILGKYTWSKETSDPHAYEIVTALNKLIEDTPESILESVYGDHCRVTLYRDGKFDCDEYDHD